MKFVNIEDTWINLDAIESIQLAADKGEGTYTLTVHFVSGRSLEKKHLDGNTSASYQKRLKLKKVAMD